MERERTVAWTDPAVVAAAGRGMSGREFLEALRDGRIPAPPYSLLLGMKLIEVDDGRAVFSAEIDESLYNTIGLVHGGFIASICDSAIGCAVATKTPAGHYAVSLDLQIRYFKPLTVGMGTIRCEGKLLNLGRTTGAGEARLFDAHGRLHALATSGLAIVEHRPRPA